MASTVLSRTQTSGSLRKFTLSAWNKRSGLSSYQGILNAYSSDSDRNAIFWQTTDEIAIYFKTSGGSQIFLQTNAKFRDTAAWYHVVVSVDTTQATESDRVKLYVNGDQITSFSTETYPSQNSDFSCIGRNTQSMKLGVLEYGAGPSTGYFDGSMAHYHFIDGTAYDASAFGETDATTGIWKPKTSPSVTYGTNGFFLKFDNSGSLGTDSSGQSNNLSISGTLSQTLDTPTNNFATLNPLASSTTPIFTDGNLTIQGNSNNSSNQGCPATIVLSSGKWYWEMKNESSSNANYIIPGFVDAEYYSNLKTGSGLPGNYYDASNGFTNNVQGGGDNLNFSIHRAGSSNSTSSGGLLQNQIYSFALDLDNRKAWFGRDGTWYNSGDPAAGTNETWSTSDIGAGKSWSPVVFHYYSASKGSFNFGSPQFSISSGNSDGNGYGNFEYAVPSGFYAINSKNLAEFG